ncbi:MAG: ATP-binding cassette domain-containing protein, partial [Nitrospina sp.]|nr:ATP-binding cassette domain-containing protein [Nitrospina sp.]
MTKNNISLSIIGLGHYFGEGESRKQVLYDNDLEIGRGEIVILTGPSGSGKTTLLTLIGGLRSVQEGSLVLFGNELKGLDKNSQIDIRKNIGFIFQAHNLFMSLTARQNVNMALELKDLPKQEMNDRSDAILSKIGLEERLLYKPQKLSGGQRQR